MERKQTPEKKTLKKSNTNTTNSKIRPESAKKPALEITRLKDNHYDPQVHEKPWIAPGKTPEYYKSTYTYDDSGLGFEVKKGAKLAAFKEKHEINQEITEKFQSFRKFREYENIRENEVIITIEYCTNCKNHSSSTRHDEEKYYQNAVALKNLIITHFPISKVYMKPLIYDTIDQSIDSLFLQKRIGAFEIQLCSRVSSKTNEKVIWSKLETKKWPNQDEILEKITEYVNKCDIIVSVDITDDNFEKMGATENKHKGINVILKPFREKTLQNKSQVNPLESESMNNTKNNEFGYGTNRSRPISAINNNNRPFSGYSNASNKTLMSLNRKMNENNSLIGKRTKVIATDEQGMAVFKGVPFDIYVIEIAETNDFKAEKMIFNVFDNIEKEQPFKVPILLQKQSLAFCFIHLVDDLVYVEKAKIDIVELNSTTKKTAFVQEIPPKSGKYEIVLDPAEYRINIFKEGYEEITRTFMAKPGTNNWKIPIKQKTGNNAMSSAGSSSNESSMKKKPISNNASAVNQKENNTQNSSNPMYQQPNQNMRPTSTKNIVIFIFDAMSNQPIANVNVHLEEQTTKKSTSYKTNAKGICNISQQNIVEGKIIIEDEKNEYFKIVEDYGPNKLNLYTMKELSFPLIKKPNTPNEIHIMALTNFVKKIMALNVICPDNTVVSNTQNDIEIQNKFEEGLGIIKLKNLQNKTGVYRFYATLFEPELFSPQYIKLYVITEKEVSLFEVPKTPFKEPAKNWDIGLIVAPNDYFFEVNAPTTKEITKNFYLREYQDLLNFIRNSKSVDLKTMLGFTHRDKLEANGDTFVSRDKIMNSLDKYGYEAKNIEHLFLSAIQHNGLYSYNKLEKKFSNLHPHITFIEEKTKGTEKNEQESGEDDEYYLDEFN